MKRVSDRIGAALLLMLGAPLLLAGSTAILLSEGPRVFFRQRRPGRGGKPFTFINLLTMRNEHDSSGNPLSRAERLPPIGALLRAARIDELPELWNVLKGDMSLVGPHPLLMEYLPPYTPEEARRHEVRPGLTGWAQMNGRDALSWEQKFASDVWYVDHRSLALDIRILLLTVGAILGRRGIAHPGSVTTARFDGVR